MKQLTNRYVLLIKEVRFAFPGTGRSVPVEKTSEE